MTQSTDWTALRRSVLERLAALARDRSLAEEGEESSSEIDVLLRETEALRADYVAGLPKVAVTRDPVGGEVVYVSLDPTGLDGPFWDAENPARPAESVSSSFVVLSGAMRLDASRIEHTPHLSLPGPDAPFVLPELLGRPGVQAVMSTVRVGPHTGYAIAYFSSNESEPPPLPNEWGRREYWLRQRGRPVTMGSALDDHPAPDFNLAPWINEGKLGWIAPGDPSMKLRWEATRCRYLMPGRHRFQRVQAGQIF